MLKRPRWKEGTVVQLEHVSRVLKGNRLGDPHVRRLAVWLPPQYDEGATRGRGRRFPVIVDLVGFTGSGQSHVAWRAFSENVPERAARLIHDGEMGPAIFVFPDCYTALGGNQYINSSAIGPYADYLLKEINPFVDREFRTLGGREHRACFGKSSGGYGAIIHGMRYADHWNAIADHSGDSYFEMVYGHDWPNTLNELAKYREKKREEGTYHALREQRRTGSGMDDGRIQRFLEKFWKKRKVSGAEAHAIMNICMAATYDPDPNAPLGFRVPYNLETGELIASRWKKWQAHDPVNLVRTHRANLKKLKGIYIDCGWVDQYHIHYGSRILSKRLHEAGIAHRYEEFDDNHNDIDYRYDVSWPFLYKAIK